MSLFVGVSWNNSMNSEPKEQLCELLWGYGFTLKREYEQIKGVSHIISLEIKEMLYAKRTFSYKTSLILIRLTFQTNQHNNKIRHIQHNCTRY
jgi:hypothetical protein